MKMAKNLHVLTLILNKKMLYLRQYVQELIENIE
jgi:hypothetical protein